MLRRSRQLQLYRQSNREAEDSQRQGDSIDDDDKTVGQDTIDAADPDSVGPDEGRPSLLETKRSKKLKKNIFRSTSPMRSTAGSTVVHDLLNTSGSGYLQNFNFPM